MTDNKWASSLLILALLLCISGSFLVFRQATEGLWIYLAGAVLLILCYLLSIPRQQTSTSQLSRQRRLHRIGFIGAVLILVSSYLIYIHFRAWPVFFFLGAMTQIIYFFRSSNP